MKIFSDALSASHWTPSFDGVTKLREGCFCTKLFVAPSNDGVQWLKTVALKILVTLFTLLTLTSYSHAARNIASVNYFSSLRASETNVRAGPSQNYPVKFTYKLKGVPVRVISEYDNWNEIEDYEKQTGWVSQSLLTKKRTLMVYTSKDFVNMYNKNSEKSRLVFHLENHVIGDYLKCLEDWCGIKINGKKGWVQKTDLFGGDEEENKKN